MTEPTAPSLDRRVPDFMPWLVAIALVLAISAAYANSFPGAFFFDDDAAILQNGSIRDLLAWRQVLWPPVTAGIGGRPFANLSFALNYAVGGTNVIGFHAVNLVIHLGAALVLFALVRRTLARPVMTERFGRSATWLAGLVALVWALNPLQANIADYVSQRTEGLMAFLYLLTLYAFVRAAENESKRWSVVAVLACALGMATKEDMVTVPVIVLLYDRTFVSGTFSAAIRRHAETYLALGSTWLLLAGLMHYSRPSERGIGYGLGATWYTYALTECRSVTRYLALSWWPHPLIFDYGASWWPPSALFPTAPKLWQSLPSMLSLAAALTVTGIAVVRWPAIGFATAWFFIGLAPSSSIVPVAQQPCAENRPYLPLAGLIALTVVLAYRAIGRRAAIGFGLAGIALGFATAARNPVFASELAVWWDTVQKNPSNARAQNNLGNSLLKSGRTAEAMPYFENALLISPHYADAHNNRGVSLLRLGRASESLVEFRVALKDKPNYADAQYNIGEAYIEMGRAADAIKALEIAIKLNPTNPKAHNNIGIALLDVGRVPESISEERLALRLNPYMPEAHYNLGNSLAKEGRNEEALREFETTVRLDPKFAKAYNNAGVALLHMGRPKEAGTHFEAALRLNPNYPEAKSNLALVRSQTSL